MFTKITHAEGVKAEDEILFSTPFGYMFPEAASSRLCLLPQTEITLDGLRELGKAMADNGSTSDPLAGFDSSIPAIFTYFGQFIDHDITARTDRDGTLTMLGMGEAILPLDPALIAARLRNGRRPQLDLDSVFGEGPGLAGALAPATTQSQRLYDADYRLAVFADADRLDLPRQKVTDILGKTTWTAIIADGRNDENLNVSQLHAAFLKFYNAVYDGLSGSDKARYVRARQLVRWTYQYVVVNDYLPAVCDAEIVRDTLANGPRFMLERGETFMPLEFSVAGFRFAHSMIRPFYRLNTVSGDVGLLDLLGTGGNAANFEPDDQLKAARNVDFSNYVGPAAQKARKIDTRIAHDLFTLPFRPDDPVLSNLAQSNLLRSYNMSIPTGQAVCDAMGVDPISPEDILLGEDPAIAAIVKGAYFHHRTPLWYYVLREAAVQQGGNRLGELGSRIVAETLIGLVKQDANSYWNNRSDSAVKAASVDVRPGAGGVIKTLADILTYAGCL